MQESLKAISSKLTAPEQAATRRTLVIGAIVIGVAAVILGVWYFMYRTPQFEAGRILTPEEKMKLIEREGGESPVVLTPKQKEIMMTLEAEKKEPATPTLTPEQKMELIKQNN